MRSAIDVKDRSPPHSVDAQGLRSSCPGEGQARIGEAGLADNFDEMAVVVDWLDCCRSRNLEALLDLFAEDAVLECQCGCECSLITGRADLAGYWAPKLANVSPDAFGLEEITPHDDEVLLDYLSFEGKPVQILFVFDAQGRIARMRCAPSSR
jgi:SnoaL-like protein